MILRRTPTAAAVVAIAALAILIWSVGSRGAGALKLDKVATDSIEGEAEIEIDTVSFGLISKTADKKLDDSFSAAQFLKLSEDDTFAKPSFERFEAGFEVGQRDYLFGVTASDLYDYEEVNLSTPSAKSGLSFAAPTTSSCTP